MPIYLFFNSPEITITDVLSPINHHDHLWTIKYSSGYVAYNLLEKIWLILKMEKVSIARFKIFKEKKLL